MYDVPEPVGSPLFVALFKLGIGAALFATCTAWVAIGKERSGLKWFLVGLATGPIGLLVAIFGIRRRD